MRVFFADDAFLNAYDWDGALRAGFTDRALKARHLGAIPGGLPRWVEKQLGQSVLRDALMNAGVLETIPGWVLQGVVRGIAHALAKATVERWLAGDTTKPKRPWDAGGGRDAEVAFVNFLDEALDQPDPLYRIRQHCDSTVSEGERAVCSALIERAGGSPQRATVLFQELQQAWTVESGQLRQFVVLHHAIAAGGAGDFNLSVNLLKELVKHKKHNSPVPWIKLYALRYLLHYLIQYAWTRDTTKSWRSVDDLLALAGPEFKRSGLADRRVEKMCRSLLEFEAIRDFKKMPTIAAANKVKKQLESLGSLSPMYRRIRAAPLGVLYLRVGAPDKALEEAAAQFAELPNDIERGVALLVQAQAHWQCGDQTAACHTADGAAAYLSPTRPFLQELLQPRRFGRLAMMYRAMYGEETLSDRLKTFAFSLLGPARLYGPFVSTRPELPIWRGGTKRSQEG